MLFVNNVCMLHILGDTMDIYSVIILLMLYHVSEGGSYIGYAETHSDGLPEHGLDEGWLTVNVSTNFPIEVYSLNDECWKCPFIHVKTMPGLTQTTIFVNTTFGTTIALKRRLSHNTKEEEFCRLHEKFSEGGNYWLFVDYNGYKAGACEVLLVNNPLPAEMPILYLFLGLCALAALIALVKLIWRKIRQSSTTFSVTDPTTKSSHDLKLSSMHTKGQESRLEMTNQDEQATTKPQAPARTRLKSLDTFRGLSLVVMIFVNYGGGGYWFFDHPPWNGLTVADLVFPWFIFIMGTSMNFSFKGMIRRNTTKLQIFRKIVKRAILLFAFGIILNTNWGPVDLNYIRIPGVLQRFSLTYLVLATIELIFINNYKTNFKERRFSVLSDVISLAPQWIISLGILGAYLGITYKLKFPGCPTGYVGPGGLHDNGKYQNCTGGAAQYIDLMVLGENHIYAHPTPQKIYQTTAPYDPEGILGTLTSIFLCFLGIQSGRILVCFETPKQRISRWITWAIITKLLTMICYCMTNDLVCVVGLFITIVTAGVIGAVLCKGSQNDGWIPLNKNLWSVSFIMVTACFAFLLLSAMYIVIDILKLWDGDPFIYPGMNSIVVYCCHDIFYRFFPVSWQVNEDHLSLLLKATWDTAIYVVLAYVLYRKKIFIAL